jgi:hypothetical protein
MNATFWNLLLEFNADIYPDMKTIDVLQETSWEFLLCQR